MKALKFKLSGKTAFFKKPDVNTYLYFTYNNIHKISLLGIFGAILGYGGYSQQENQVFPEFYEKLKDIKISIVPLSEEGIFKKKIQTFNNSVGYASREVGGNLIVQEQWIEDPAWEIYIMLDCDEAENLKEFIINKKAVYIPYLGKNDHPADITEIEVVDLNQNKNNCVIDSLCINDKIDFDYEEFDDEEGNLFVYKEYLPVELDEQTNLYKNKEFILTNALSESTKEEIYNAKGKNIIFY